MTTLITAAKKTNVPREKLKVGSDQSHFQAFVVIVKKPPQCSSILGSPRTLLRFLCGLSKR